MLLGFLSCLDVPSLSWLPGLQKIFGFHDEGLGLANAEVFEPFTYPLGVYPLRAL